eukprot:6180207-Heterocapsa_arctica.AAC.1
MNKANQIQAHKRDKHIKTQNKDSENIESGDTLNIHAVENRRQQYQGYLDQKEDRETEEKSTVKNKELKQKFKDDRKNYETVNGHNDFDENNLEEEEQINTQNKRANINVKDDKV